MSLLTDRVEGEQPVLKVTYDIIRRGLIVGPVFLIIGGSIWGLAGVSSVAFGLGLLLANFWLSAALISYSARISLALLMGSVLFGFLLRLGIIFVAFWLTRNAGWMNVIAFGLTLIILHLGLLIWELKYISASLAYPGLKPKGKELKKKQEKKKEEEQELENV